MSEGLQSALITLIVGLVSALVSWVTSRRTINSELQKIKFEVQKLYAGKRLEMRSNAYPPLYCMLSDFAKKIRFGEVSRETVRTLFNDINEWDSKNAICFSEEAAGTCYHFTNKLNEILRDGDDKKFSSREFLGSLREEVGKFEDALKIDLGVTVDKDIMTSMVVKGQH